MSIENLKTFGKCISFATRAVSTHPVGSVGRRGACRQWLVEDYVMLLSLSSNQMVSMSCVSRRRRPHEIICCGLWPTRFGLLGAG